MITLTILLGGFFLFCIFEEKESMMKFQLERIALFSDAVFAIAITLMMIEVRPPHLHEGSSFSEDLSELLKMTPTFFGTILSFILIGFFWTRHHKLMKYVKTYNAMLIWLNIVFLLSIAFIPFSTAFVFENAVMSPLPLWCIMSIISWQRFFAMFFSTMP